MLNCDGGKGGGGGGAELATRQLTVEYAKSLSWSLNLVLEQGEVAGRLLELVPSSTGPEHVVSVAPYILLSHCTWPQQWPPSHLQ